MSDTQENGATHAMRPLMAAAHESLITGPWTAGSVPAGFDSDVSGMPDQYGQARIISGRVCRALLDGPLSDLSVLVQIPKVRELAVELADIESQFGDDYLFQKHNEAHVRPWLDALEATEGDA